MVNAVKNIRVLLLNIQTSGHNVVWQPDTAASRDIWSPKQVAEYEEKTGRLVRLSPSSVKLFAYGGTAPLELKGQFEASLQAGDNSVKTNIIVTQDDSTYPLLSERTARKLGVVSYDHRFMVKKVRESTEIMHAPELKIR